MTEHTRMAALLGVFATFMLSISAAAQDDAEERYNYRDRVWDIAFDPDKFFPERYNSPAISITYSGDDYGFPVYAFAIRRGCTEKDKGEARKGCFEKMVARMVRSPWPEGEPERPRWRGSRLLGEIEKAGVSDDAELRDFLSKGAVEWMEADIANCPAAMDQLMKFREIDFLQNEPIVSEDSVLLLALHADKITLEYGSYLARSRHYGAEFDGTPMKWAAAFVDSFEGCWAPSTAPAPWTSKEN